MRAVVLKGFGGLENLAIENLPDPQPKRGNAVIQVKAFGINHAEMHMRRGEWGQSDARSNPAICLPGCPRANRSMLFLTWSATQRSWTHFGCFAVEAGCASRAGLEGLVQ